MRDNEDQMGPGSAGRMRGQGHVRIPQRRINNSLRTGVSPSMQPTAGNGQFQNGVHISPRVQPVRQMGPNRGRMFNQFMRRATGNQFQQGRASHFQGAGNGQDNPILQHLLNKSQGHMPGLGPRFPMQGGNPPIAGGQHIPQPFVPGRNEQRPQGNPILGSLNPHQNPIQQMIQAMMGDLGGGVDQNQFANMQQGNLPGGMGGDFLKALGGGQGNNDILQALVQHLIANTGTDSLGQPQTGYSMDPNGGMQAIQRLLGMGTRHHAGIFPRPPKPPRYLGPPVMAGGNPPFAAGQAGLPR